MGPNDLWNNVFLDAADRNIRIAGDCRVMSLIGFNLSAAISEAAIEKKYLSKQLYAIPNRMSEPHADFSFVPSSLHVSALAQDRPAHTRWTRVHQE